MSRVLWLWILCLLTTVVGPGNARGAGTTIGLAPSLSTVSEGEEFTVQVVLPESNDPINGYDAVIGFDPARLQLLLPQPASAGEGELFDAACAQSFLSTTVAPDSTKVTIAHVLLCAGTSVTGPGVLYELRFRARQVPGLTALVLLDGTAAYNAGTYVTPVVTADAVVQIGSPTAAPEDRHTPPAFFARPNPFNPATELCFDSARSQHVRIDLFTVAGRAVASLFDGTVDSGPVRIRFDGRDRDGHALQSGVFIARLTTESGLSTTTKLILLR